jgi:hypothetical protein
VPKCSANSHRFGPRGKKNARNAIANTLHGRFLPIV